MGWKAAYSTGNEFNWEMNSKSRFDGLYLAIRHFGIRKIFKKSS
jgi:hypothetical protein